MWINPDGSVEVRCGTQDLGTGTKTLIAIVAAEVFGLEPAAISVRIGDTTFPQSGGSGGSTTAASVAPAVFDACQNALAELASASKISDPTGSNWRAATARLRINPVVARGRWRGGTLEPRRRRRANGGSGSGHRNRIRTELNGLFVCKTAVWSLIGSPASARSTEGSSWASASPYTKNEFWIIRQE